MLRKLNYSKKVALILAACILIPCIIIFCLFFRNQITKVSANVDKEVQEVIDSVSDEAEELSVMLSQKARFIMFYSELNSVLQSTQPQKITPEHMQKNVEINNVIDALFAENDIIEMNVYTTNKNARLTIVKHIENEDEFAHIPEDSVGEWRIENHKLGNMLTYYKKYRLSSEDYNVIKISVPLKPVFKSFSNLSYDEAYIRLAYEDTSSEAVFTYNDGRYNETKMPRKLMHKTKGIIEPFGIETEVYVNTSVIYNNIFTITGIFIGILIIMTAVIFLIASLISKNILKDIMRIVEGINTNNIDYIENSVYDSKEIEAIKNYLIELRRKLKEENDDRLRFELDLLSERISPHFLYNNLSAIKHNSHDVETRKTIDGLVRYYRNVFQKGGRMTSVTAEIENGIEYLNFLKFSYEKDFDINIDIDDECIYKSIPANILQPVLENAFIHGINNNSDSHHGIIDIKAVTEDEDVIITVTDNGGKFNEQRFKQRMEDETRNHAFKNIMKRMKLYYNDDKYNVSISGDSRKTVVAFRFGKEV